MPLPAGIPLPGGFKALPEEKLPCPGSSPPFPGARRGSPRCGRAGALLFPVLLRFSPGPKAGGLRQREMREGEAENSPLGSPTSIGTWRIPQRKKGGIPHRVVQHARHPTPVPSRPPSLPSAVFSTHLKAAFSRPITSLHPWSTPKPAARTPKILLRPKTRAAEGVSSLETGSVSSLELSGLHLP